MCKPSTPDIPDPVEYQQAKAPVYRDSKSTGQASSGRRGTMLTSGMSSGSSAGAKKTLLGT